MSLPLLQALFLSGFQPRRVALANRDTSPAKAYLTHWIGLVMFGLVGLAVLMSDPELDRELRRVFNNTFVDPGVGVLICAAVVLSVEIGFVLLGLLLLPWSDVRAAVKPLCRHALRTSWLHTTHLGMVLCAYTVTHILCDEVLGPFRRYRWDPDAPARTTVWWVHWLADHYWYALPVLFAGGGVWCLGALLRAVSARVLPEEDRPPPLCEACGYNLSYHRDPKANCPECGRPVARSLGEHLRSPAGWGRHAEDSRRKSFWRATFNAWFKPEEFFMGLSAFRGLGSAGAFLVCHLVLTTAAFTAGFAVPFGILIYDSSLVVPLAFLLYVAFWYGAAVALGLGCLASLAAAIAGLLVCRQEGRNALGTCLRVPCYLAGVFPIWAASTMAFLVTGMGIAVRMRRPGSMPLDVYVVISFFSLHAIFLVIYVGGVVRRIRHLRYANT